MASRAVSEEGQGAGVVSRGRGGSPIPPSLSTFAIRLLFFPPRRKLFGPEVWATKVSNQQQWPAQLAPRQLTGSVAQGWRVRKTRLYLAERKQWGLCTHDKQKLILQRQVNANS